MENFREIRDITLKEAVAFEVSDAEELSNLLSRLLGDPKWRGRVREKSFQMFNKYRGATERSIRQLEEWIEKNSVLYKGG
jgi:3-deoxy-D-manno-octulosonic-acid transferase